MLHQCPTGQNLPLIAELGDRLSRSQWPVHYESKFKFGASYDVNGSTKKYTVISLLLLSFPQEKELQSERTGKTYITEPLPVRRHSFISLRSAWKKKYHSG
jgi:hypothetical protein